MKPLKRPMFRSGGPIREGIMDGMIDRPGYKKGSIIGGLVSKIPGGQALIDQGRGIIPRIFNRIKPTFKMQPGKVTQSRTIIGNKPDGTPIYGFSGAKQKYISQTMPPVPFMEKAGAFVKENPYITGLTAPFLVSGAVTSAPTIAEKGAQIAKAGALQATDLLVPDFIFDQDKFLENKKIAKLNQEIKKSENVPTVTDEDDPDKPNKPDPAINREAEIEANRKRYYKLMGIDKMKKGAIYNSLIDASTAIQEEGGDLKGSIKRGDLQSKIIKAISKNLDESTDMKKQIDAAILKGEIEKDINKEKNTLDKMVKEKQLKVLDKQLKGGTLNETLSELQTKQGIVPEGPELAALAIQKDIKIPAGHTFNTKDVNTFLKDNPTLNVVDFVNDQNRKLQETGKGNLNPGNYVVGKNIVTVGEDGTVTDVIV